MTTEEQLQNHDANDNSPSLLLHFQEMTLTPLREAERTSTFRNNWRSTWGNLNTVAKGIYRIEPKTSQKP